MPGQQSNGPETSAQGSITAQAAVRIRGRQQVGGAVSNDVFDVSRDDPPAIRTRRLAAPRLTLGILSFGCLSSGTPRRPDRSASLWRTGRLRHECRSGRAGGALGSTPMPNLCPSRCAIVGNYDIKGLRPPQSRSLGSPPIAAPTIAFLLEPCRAARVLWRPNAAGHGAAACSSAASTASSQSCGWSPKQAQRTGPTLRRKRSRRGCLFEALMSRGEAGRRLLPSSPARVR
jgi:hypothetical protein